MNWIKIYLPIYILLYFFIAFVVPTYRIFKQSGINPITFGKSDTPHNYIGFIMKILLALLFISVVIFSFFSNLYMYLAPIKILENQFLFYAGIIVIHISLIWICIAQYQMSNSWRIGIDENNKTALITKGVFSVSRNPIFLGMILSVLGLFLIMPNALTFCLSINTYIIIQIQIRLEEEFLEKTHGQDYLNYKLKTKRLL